MEKSTEELQKIAKEVRRDLLKMIYQAEHGHPGGSLSSTDIFVALYFGGILKYDPKKPNWEDRDRFVLSAGHYCPAFYTVLAKTGFFSAKMLSTYCQLGSPLQGHPHNLSLPGVETSSGPLGQGLSQAVGMALAAKMDKKTWQVYCLLSDGEQNEGQVWEAVMTAAKYKLDNLTAIVDKNGVQIDGTTDEIMPLGDLRAKYEAFGWEAKMIGGNEIGEVIRVITRLRQGYGGQGGKPKIVIAETVFGKGVSFMEKDFRWHSKPLDEKELKQALKELI